MNPFKSLLKLSTALDAIFIIPMLVIAAVVVPPAALYHVYELSSEDYLWLFLLITLVYVIVVIYSVYQFKTGKIPKTDCWGNIIVFALAGYGGLGFFLTAVQA